MARVLVLLLCVSMCLLKNGCSLIWEENLKAQYVNCTGENVVFPWRYTLEKGDNLIAISWSHRVPGAQKETTFGTYGLGAFDSADERISQVDTAGIKVSNVSRSDSGTYIVNVRLSGGVASQTTSLLVAEPPQTKTGKLEAFVNNVTASVTTQTSSSSSSSSSASNHRLMCGNFIHLGTPPSTVVWKDPDGSLLPSTSYDAGYFILELPRESMGGQYQCLLNANSTANVNIENVNIENVNIENVNIENVNIENVNIENVNIENVNIENVNIENVNIEIVNMRL
ncbi:hypothetical protein ACOMHN_059273 [Nucella lapillus]